MNLPPLPLEISSSSFFHANASVMSAELTDKIVGIFESKVLFVNEGFERWSKIIWDGIQTNKNIYFLMRYGDTVDLSKSLWIGPFYSSEIDISKIYNKYIQIICVMELNEINTPSISSISLQFISTSVLSKFFTVSNYIGFKPKTVLLTYRGVIDQDAIINFAISSKDTSDAKFYQYISPNKFNVLNELSPDSERIKLMIEMTGTSNVEISIDSFSLTFGGDNSVITNL